MVGVIEAVMIAAVIVLGVWLAWLATSSIRKGNHESSLIVVEPRKRKKELGMMRLLDHDVEAPVVSITPERGRLHVQAEGFHVALNGEIGRFEIVGSDGVVYHSGYWQISLNSTVHDALDLDCELDLNPMRWDRQMNDVGDVKYGWGKGGGRIAVWKGNE